MDKLVDRLRSAVESVVVDPDVLETHRQDARDVLHGRRAAGAGPAVVDR